MPRLVVDTGFLVALYLRGDRLHRSAIAFLKNHRAPLITAAPVIVEASYFLSPAAKVELLKWVERGGLEVIEVGKPAFGEIGRLIEKYADIDFTGAALIWLANSTGERRILTVDEPDFSLFRLKGGRRFETVAWMQAD